MVTGEPIWAQEAEQDDAGQAESVLTPAEEAELMRALQADAGETAKPANAVIRAVPSLNPDMTIIADFALAWFSDDNLQTGGHDPRETGFNLQQLEMSLGGSVDHVFRFDANLVFSLAGVEIEEAVVTTLGIPCGIQVRAGQFLSRVGRLNATHPHAWDFVDQPFAVGKMYGSEGNRGLGAEVSWLTPLPWYVEIAGAAQMPTSAASNRSFMGNTDDVNGAQDFLYTVTVKQFFDLGRSAGLFWGLSAQWGPNDTGRGNRTDIYATDVYFKYAPASHPEMFVAVQAEAWFRLRQVPRDLLFDGAGYVQIAWQINREWATAVRGEYGSGLTGDMLDPEWDADRWRAALSATWMPSHFSRLRAQASLDLPQWKSTPIYALVLALEISIGSHPAHAY